MARQGPGPEPANPHNQESTDDRARRRAWSILRLMRTGTPETLPDPELQQEFEHLYQLLQRIEALAEQELDISASPLVHDTQPEPDPISQQQHDSTADPAPMAQPTSEPAIDPDLIEFDPFTFDDPAPEWASEAGDDAADTISDVLDDQPAPPETGESAPFEPPSHTPDKNLDRWWVNFNGELSLERLARLRKALGDSPFTIETRFEEITDGLIVLRLVTEPHLTLEQVEWIVEQVMQNVGLDRNAAIVSRN